MDNQNQTKKCFCSRCFLPIDPDDRVDIEEQNFHRLCSMCCICRTIPTSLKMFYGHVFCDGCFKTHVLSRFRGETPKMHSNSWWMQWAPGTKPQESSNSDNKDESKTSANSSMPEEPEKKRFICSRCLHAVDENEKVDIGGQCFHPQCARCYFCHAVPTENLKIYYGQVFCEQCFQQHVLKRNKDNPNEFFKNCFEQWQNNAQFAENMRTFMGGSKDSTPFVFMMQNQQPPFCHCGAGNEWGGHNEARKSATPGDVSIEDETSTWDLSFENRTEFSDIPESCNAIEDLDQFAAEKIEKLTKYLHESVSFENQTELSDIPESCNAIEDLDQSETEKIEKLTKYLQESVSFENRTEFSDIPKSCNAIEDLDQSAAEKIEKLTKYLSESDRTSRKKWKNFTEFNKILVASEVSQAWVELRGCATSLDCPKCLWQRGPIYVNSELLERDLCCGNVSE